MKLPRDISGRDLAKTLIRHWGYRQVNQVGSHIILQTKEPEHHRLSVPDHSPLRLGTLNSILRASRRRKASLAKKFWLHFKPRPKRRRRFALPAHSMYLQFSLFTIPAFAVKLSPCKTNISRPMTARK
jgi:predicted RNA binding protein YcfA (HicA-like mRNA interferase family)